jgi:thiosulfate dehydrogenase
MIGATTGGASAPQESFAMPIRPAFLAVLTVAAAPALAEGLGEVEAVHYGRRLVAETSTLIGPEVSDSAMRFAGNNLACASCHIDAGTRPHGLALVGVSAKYPRPLPGGGAESLADRVNGCMTRSMNGRPLPEDGREMAAIVAYLEDITALGGSFGDPAEAPAPLPPLSRPADPARGARLYQADCAACHGADGAGMRKGQPEDTLGYLHPPLWGPDSFNAAAGMHDLATAAAFIHSNMPPGSTAAAPQLLPEDAWDIAAFIEAQPRPPAPDPGRR